MKYISTLALAVLLASCGQESTTNTELDKLYAERDSLAEVQGKISDRMREIENEILVMDSTRRLTSVTTIVLNETPFEHYFQVYGTVEASKSISVYPEASGIITRLLVSRGQKVAEGQLLAEIDASLLVRNIEEVKTSLELATTLYEKQRKLWLDEKIGSEVQYLQAKNNKEALETRLATLREQLGKTKVRAPFSGAVDEIFPKEGEMASPAQPIIRLVNLSDVYISTDVSESYVGTITKGAVAQVNFTSINKVIESKVIQVGQYINPANRTFKVDIALDGSGDLYKPNMLAQIKILDYQTDSVIVIPNSIVQQSPSGKSFVYIVKPFGEDLGVVEKVEVQPGRSYDDKVEILSGLSKGVVLINKGSRSVKDGQHVRITNL